MIKVFIRYEHGLTGDLLGEFAPEQIGDVVNLYKSFDTYVNGKQCEMVASHFVLNASHEVGFEIVVGRKL